MNKKYITLINQTIQGYHLEKTELEDLQLYLKRHLENVNTLINNKQKNDNKY